MLVVVENIGKLLNAQRDKVFGKSVSLTTCTVMHFLNDHFYNYVSKRKKICNPFKCNRT